MTPLIGILGCSLVLGLASTPLARLLARRLGLVDEPDGQRKIHQRVVPTGGGLAVLLAASAALALAAVFWEPVRAGLAQPSLAGLAAAAIVVCLVGLADDRWELRGRYKLLGQLAAVAIVMYSGLVVEQIRLFDWTIELGLLAIPFTAFWLLGAINSLNLIDGMDGLLSGVGASICLAMAVLAFWSGNVVAAAIAVALAGALLAFLCFNFPPASIFLGDSGSMLVGLVVGVLAIQSSLKGPATVALAAPTALLIIPIFDTLSALVRRTLTGRSIYSTDRGHVHHCLLRHGLSSRRALFVIWALCWLTVVGVLASLAFQNELFALASALAVMGILVVKRLFGYAELLLIKERLVGWWVTMIYGPSRGVPHQLEVRLQGSADWRELWRALTDSAVQMNLSLVCLDVNAPAIHEGYHARWDRCDSELDNPQVPWRAEIPLVVGEQVVGRLEVAGRRDHQPVHQKVAAVARLAEEVEHAVGRLTAGQEPADVSKPNTAALLPEAPRLRLCDLAARERIVS
jgi:UDP-GlcNAc:undecaprenyl-phosphate GlcNAc-1-phosphate transferase